MKNTAISKKSTLIWTRQVRRLIIILQVCIKEIAPQLLLERRCDTANVAEALATKRISLKSALAEKGTNFQTVIVEVRKEILIDAIKKGLSIKEIYPLLGYPEPSNVYWFAKRFFGMSFNDFYRKIKKEI